MERSELVAIFYLKIDSQGLSRDFSLSGNTEIEEKIDGSQLSFCFHDDKLVFFNRGREIKEPYDEVL